MHCNCIMNQNIKIIWGDVKHKNAIMVVDFLMYIFPFQNWSMYVHVLLQICIITSEHVGKKSQTMWPYSIVGVTGKNKKFQLI